MSRPMSTSPAATSQPGAVDTQFESMIDFSEFDNMSSYRSPSLSPTASQKASFAQPAVKPEPTASSLLPASQVMSGPSHRYDLYKQQTPIVPGSLATTIAVNQNAQIQGYNAFSLDYLGLNSPDDSFDFNSVPNGGGDMDPEFDSASPDNSFFFESTVNPTTLAVPESLPSPAIVPTQTAPAGRMWPGIHQQTALAKAQAQQRQQQQIIQQQQQQQQQQQNVSAKPPSHKSKPSQSNDPIVEQKISQLLNSMRAKASADGLEHTPALSLQRSRKDEDDMDEDERLLASEEGKKLTSKERRQLRNKVSARAFRSRRKEYITQLEAEIANKVTENGDLRSQNRALIDENKRLSDLTRMLLSSPSFSNFLDNLSSNPQQIPQPVPQQQQQQQQQPQSAIPKDVNPYASQPQQIGVAMVPDQPMVPDVFGYQPQVYAVLSTPEPPPGVIDSAAMSGKTSNFVGCVDDEPEDDSTKVEAVMPAMMPDRRRPAAKVEEPTAPTPVVVVDEAFENDPAFALYHEEISTCVKAEEQHEQQQQPRELEFELDARGLSRMDMFGSLGPEKALARFELVDASEEEASAVLAMERVQRISAALEDVRARLEAMTEGL